MSADPHTLPIKVHRSTSYLDLNLVIVVPQSIDQYCGLLDHASVLADMLRTFGVAAEICRCPPFSFSERRAPILLEFTPLSYSKVGLSLPLLLQLILSRLNGNAVIIYFHELPFANGWSLKRTLAVTSQRIYCYIAAAISNCSIVNQKSELGWLRWSLPFGRFYFLPTFSNVGEAESVLRPDQRPLQVVIFGSPGKRRHAHCIARQLGGYRKLFGEYVNVLDIGEPLSPAEGLPDDVHCLGPLPKADAFAHLLNSRFGFFYSEPHQFSKSGVFAAYCAAGVIPIIATLAPSSSDLYLSPYDLQQPDNLLEKLALTWQNTRLWYCKYGVQQTALMIKKMVANALVSSSSQA